MRGWRGFTIVEVVAAVSIVAIVAAIVFAVSVPIRENARQAACVSQLRQIYAALQMYAADYDPPHRIPGMTDLSTATGPGLDEYLPSKELLYCPDTPPIVRRRWGSTYGWSIIAWSRFPSEPPTEPFMLQWYHRTLKRLEELGGATPIVGCTIHDEVYYLPREENVDPSLLGPFRIQLRLDGSIYRGRTDDPRGYFFTGRWPLSDPD